MSAARKQRPPTFLWQGIFIMLPVVLLAVVSLISLREDERAAEEDARKRAAQNVQSLAVAIRASVDEELHEFLTLQNIWQLNLWLAGQPSSEDVEFTKAKLKADVEKWEQDHSGLKFANLVTPDAQLFADGRQITPPDFPGAPVPPKWFTEFTPQQKTLWESLRSAGDSTEIAQREQAFLKSKPPEPSRTAALRLHWPPEQQMDENAIPTETGVSFEQIACYQLLSAPHAQLTSNLLQSVWWQTIIHPSFFSPKLLELAGALTNHAAANLQKKFIWTQQTWNNESKTRAWLESVRMLSRLTNNWNSPPAWMSWASNSDKDALVLFQSCTLSNRITNEDGVLENVPVSRHAYLISFFQREFIELVFANALMQNKILIPDYVRVGIEVEGKQLSMFNTNVQTNDQPLLGTAKPTAGPRMTSDWPDYELKFYLASRERLLASAHRRTLVFLGLVLGALMAASVGCFAAWLSFRRQLQLNQLKSNFVSSVSHELRAPIASMRLMAENLAGGKVAEAPKQNEYFRFIVQECRRLSSLIENVLDFSRIEQGRKQYEFEPTDLVGLTQTTVKLMEPYAAEKGVKLELKSEIENRKSEMDLDGHAIQQALVNLIDNAIKHSPKEETVTVGIEVVAAVCDRRLESEDANRRSQTAATVRLFVSDHGPGIPQAEQEKIFERFYRRGSELRRETQGAGIGLSIVKHIVEAHGGRVTVQSEAGHGSRFTIELSFYQQEQTEITESKP